MAMMPQTAHAGLRVLPADPSWFAKGFSGNVLIIEQRWSIARGTSIDAECNISPPHGEVAELMPLEQFAGAQGPHGVLDGPGVRTVSLATGLHSGAKPQNNLRALLLAHTEPLAEPLTDPIIVHIRLIAF